MISDLSEIDRKQFLYELKDYLITYRYNLGVEKKQTFGVEIEFVGKNCDNLEKNISIEQLQNFRYETKYDFNTNKTYGGEMVSKVLKDQMEDWKQLKEMCEFLVENNYLIDNRCGGHIHIGSQALSSSKALKRLIKIWSMFEDIIYYFSCTGGNFRPSMESFASPLALKMRQILLNKNKINIKNIHEYFPDYKRSAIDFTRTYDLRREKRCNTIEFRCPNGTLDYIIWQNNINFFIKLLSRCNKGGNFDIIDKYIKEQKFATGNLNDYQKINIDKAIVLSDFIFNKEEDKKNFLKQYIKNNQKSL